MKLSTRTTVFGATAALVLGSCLVAGITAPAFAASSTETPSPFSTHKSGSLKTLAEIRLAGATQTGKRLTSLHNAMAKITTAKGVTNADRATILMTINTDISGITALASKISTDMTPVLAARDYRSITTQFRVYEVTLPQARLAVAADTLVTVTLPKLTATEKHSAALLSGKRSAVSTAALQADLADITARVSSAMNQVSATATTALAVTPAEYNAHHSVLEAVTSSMVAARTDVKHARADVAALRAALKTTGKQHS